MKKILFLFSFALMCATSFGQVIKAVHDGDSYKILMDTDTWVRIEAVDCPEIISDRITADQPYGRMVGDTIRKLIKGRKALVYPYGVDIYGRYRAQIYVNGVDVAELILRNGWGWYSRSNDLDRSTRIRYRKARDYAKRNKMGLWADEKPIEPKVWRKKNTRFLPKAP